MHRSESVVPPPLVGDRKPTLIQSVEGIATVEH